MQLRTSPGSGTVLDRGWRRSRSLTAHQDGDMALARLLLEYGADTNDMNMATKGWSTSESMASACSESTASS